MPVAASRAVLRQSQFLTRRTPVRHASSTSEAASKANQSASSAASKATEGLSRVSSSAGPAITNAAQGVGNALKNVGGRTGKIITIFECKRRPLFGHFQHASTLYGAWGHCNDWRGVVISLFPALSTSLLTMSTSLQYLRLCVANPIRCWNSYDTPYRLLLESRN